MNYTKTNLAKALAATQVDITFVKENGRKRTLRATLQPGSYPAEYASDVRRTIRNIKGQENITVFAPKENGFRTIRFDRITNVKRLAA